LKIPVSDGSGGCTLSNITTDAGKNNIIVPGSITGQSFTSSDTAHSGDLNLNGLTSGTASFVVADVAGTAIAYILPSDNSAGTGKFLQDTGSTTCPTLPAGAPATCHGTTWTAATVTGGTCTNQAVTIISTSGVPTCATITSAYLNITATTCTAPQVVTAISSGGVGTCTAPLLTQNSQSAAYTTVLGDAGKQIYHPGADTTARTWTIDSNANVAYLIGTCLTFINDTSAGVLTIAITSDTMILAGAGTTGSRTLAASNIATACKMTSTRWIISGSSGLT